MHKQRASGDESRTNQISSDNGGLVATSELSELGDVECRGHELLERFARRELSVLGVAASSGELVVRVDVPGVTDRSRYCERERHGH